MGDFGTSPDKAAFSPEGAADCSPGWSDATEGRGAEPGVSRLSQFVRRAPNGAMEGSRGPRVPEQAPGFRRKEEYALAGHRRRSPAANGPPPDPGRIPNVQATGARSEPRGPRLTSRSPCGALRHAAKVEDGASFPIGRAAR